MSALLLTLALAFLIGVSATILLIVLGSVGVTGSIFIGLLITVVLGTFLNWALFHPLTPIENGVFRMTEAKAQPTVIRYLKDRVKFMQL